MLEQGLIQRSSSAFSSSVLPIKKADGSWHFCVDYHALNAITIKDAWWWTSSSTSFTAPDSSPSWTSAPATTKFA
jgi:hypothetical protein